MSETIDILKILVKGSAIAGATAFNTLAEISSIPVALEIFNLVIRLKLTYHIYRVQWCQPVEQQTFETLCVDGKWRNGDLLYANFGYTFMSRNKQSRKHLFGRSYKNDEFDWALDLVTETGKYNPNFHGILRIYIISLKKLNSGKMFYTQTNGGKVFHLNATCTGGGDSL